VDSVFHGAVDPADIALRAGGWPSWGATRAVGRTVWFRAGSAMLTARETPAALGLLVHECVHVWQYGAIGWAYAVRSLGHQLVCTLREGSRNGAYRYTLDPARPFSRYGIEQQAQMIEDHYLRTVHALSGSTRMHCANLADIGAAAASELVERYLDEEVRPARLAGSGAGAGGS
jgi:hypothetical protein